MHREGRYADDVTPYIPGESASGEGGFEDADGDGIPDGRGRGARGETVLGDREAGEPAGDSSWLERALRELGRWLDGFGLAASGPLGWALLAVGLALVAIFVGYLVSGMRLGRPPDTVHARSTTGSDGPIDPMLVAPELSADELAAQQRWGEAIHALFVGALGRVGGREGRLRGRTARELVRAVDHGRAGREELGELLDITEVVWFGARDATEDQYRHARSLASHVGEGPAPELEDRA